MEPLVSLLASWPTSPCSTVTPDRLLAGAYGPADANDVPPEVVDAVAVALVDNPNITFMSEVFACESNVSAMAMDACSQVGTGRSGGALGSGRQEIQGTVLGCKNGMGGVRTRAGTTWFLTLLPVLAPRWCLVTHCLERSCVCRWLLAQTGSCGWAWCALVASATGQIQLTS